jgi:hypothetical protein
MAIKVRKISGNSFVWSCTNCGASGTGATQFEANKNGVKHDRTVHGGRPSSSASPWARGSGRARRAGTPMSQTPTLGLALTTSGTRGRRSTTDDRLRHPHPPVPERPADRWHDT